MIKILSWNIQQGGGSRLAGIVSALQKIEAQIVVLSEYRNNESGIRLRHRCLGLGYRYQYVSQAKANDNSVIILSRFPCQSELFTDIDPLYSANVVKVEFDAFAVYGMYLPHKKKHRIFDTLLTRVQSESKPMILCGDLNTGVNYVDQVGNSFWYENEFEMLITHGCIDAYRHVHGDKKDYSWYSHQGNGYRYDHTLIHRDMSSLISTCDYLHEYREKGLSDHSPMLLILG